MLHYRPMPTYLLQQPPPALVAATYEARIAALKAAAGCDWVVVYGDREHVGSLVYVGARERDERAGRSGMRQQSDFLIPHCNCTWHVERNCRRFGRRLQARVAVEEVMQQQLARGHPRSKRVVSGLKITREKSVLENAAKTMGCQACERPDNLCS